MMVRESGMEIGNGTAVIAQIPKVDGEYDLATLRDYMLSLKRDYPDTTQASVLLEPAIPYDYLIQVMDIVRSAEIGNDTAALVAEESPDAGAPAANAPEPTLLAQQSPPTRLELFPEISVGEAP